MKKGSARKLLSNREKWTRRRYRTVMRIIMALEAGKSDVFTFVGAETSIIADLRAAGYKAVPLAYVKPGCCAMRWSITWQPVCYNEAPCSDHSVIGHF